MAAAATKGRKLSSLAAALLAATAALLLPASTEASRYLPTSLPAIAAPQPSFEGPTAGDVDDSPRFVLLTAATRADLSALAAGARLEEQRFRLLATVLELARGHKTASGGVTTGVAANIWGYSYLAANLRWCNQSGQNLLFQGLWTDPVSGLSYARARWYDARNATWLSPDPLLDIDSPNLYAAFGWQPHGAIDPMGLDSLGQMVHGYTEQAWSDEGTWWQKLGRRTLASVGEVAYATVEFSSVGAVGEIDEAQEQMESGEIDTWEYTAKVSGVVGRTAGVMAAGGGIGQGAAKLAQSAGMAARYAGAVGGAAGGFAGKLTEDVVDVKMLKTETEYSSWQEYASATVVGGAFGFAEGLKVEQGAPPQVQKNYERGMDFDEYVRATNLRAVEEFGQLGLKEQLPAPELSSQSKVIPDYTIYKENCTVAAYADAKSGEVIPFDEQARGFVLWAKTTASKTFVYYTPEGTTPIDPRLLNFGQQEGVRILQVPAKPLPGATP